MKTSGVLIAILGVWVTTQVLGGDGLARLGITGKAQVSVNIDPKTGVPNQNPGLPFLKGPEGYPY